MDFYTKAYRMLRQRAERNPENDLYAQTADIARNLFDGPKTKKEVQAIINAIKRLEKHQPAGMKKYGLIMDQAVKGGDYTLKRPHCISHRYNSARREGSIYVLKSPEKPGLYKLGATTLEMRVRINRYQTRYGYPVSLVYQEFVADPFGLEKAVSDKLSGHKAQAWVKGESNEWFKIGQRRLVAEIKSQILSRGN